jgi:hypothetical protein
MATMTVVLARNVDGAAGGAEAVAPGLPHVAARPRGRPQRLPRRRRRSWTLLEFRTILSLSARVGPSAVFSRRVRALLCDAEGLVTRDSRTLATVSKCPFLFDFTTRQLAACELRTVLGVAARELRLNPSPTTATQMRPECLEMFRSLLGRDGQTHHVAAPAARARSSSDPNRRAAHRL